MVDHLQYRPVTHLLSRFATAALNTCHTTASMHATRLWVSQQEDVNCSAHARHITRHRAIMNGDKSMDRNVKLQTVRAPANNTFTSTRTNAAVKSLSRKSPCKAHKQR